MKGVLYVYPSCSPIFKFSHFRWVCCNTNETYCTEYPHHLYTMQCYVVYAHIKYPSLHFTPSSNNKRHTMQSVSAQTPLLAHLIFSTRQKMMSKRDYIIMMNVQTFLVGLTMRRIFHFLCVVCEVFFGVVTFECVSICQRQNELKM